jgi:hypothetical protein
MELYGLAVSLQITLKQNLSYNREAMQMGLVLYPLAKLLFYITAMIFVCSVLLE